RLGRRLPRLFVQAHSSNSPHMPDRVTRFHATSSPTTPTAVTRRDESDTPRTVTASHRADGTQHEQEPRTMCRALAVSAGRSRPFCVDPLGWWGVGRNQKTRVVCTGICTG